jgi:hypothetical protein
MLTWEDRELLRRVTEALESISASLTKMNKLTQEHKQDRALQSMRDVDRRLKARG